MNPDQLATLEEERDFLLRSISDLDREHAAGDVTDDDFQTLRDDYTARAAAIIRSIEEGRAALPPKRPFDLRRLGTLVAVSIVVVVGISWWLTRSAERDTTAAPTAEEIADLCPPQTTDINTLLVDARTAMTADASCALQLFQSVLEQEPDNTEALTYAGWVIAFDAMMNGIEGEEKVARGELALELIDRARERAPEYIDAQCFTAIVRYRFLDDAVGAAEPLERCRSGQLPTSVAPLIEQLGVKIDEALATTTETTG